MGGVTVLEDVLEADEVAEIRARLDEQAAQERLIGRVCMDGGHGQRPPFTAANGGINQRVFMLVNKGREFWPLIDHPATAPIVRATLGQQYLLSSCQANIVNPGGQAMPLHVDQWWMPDTYGDLPGDRNRDSETEWDAPIGVCNTIWMLTDFTEENGATIVEPDHRPPYAITGRAGSVIIYDGLMVHGAGENRTWEPRVAILCNYCGPQFRPQENYTLGLDERLWPFLSPLMKRLLGFESWHGYGRTENVTGQWEPGTDIGRLPREQ